MLPACSSTRVTGFSRQKACTSITTHAGIETTMLHWPDEDATPNVMEYLKERKIDLVINIPKNLSKTELENDYSIRRNAIDFNIPLITNSKAGCRVHHCLLPL